MQRQQKANIIDCQGRGLNGLLKVILNDRYEIVKALSKGCHGQIYLMNDLRNKRQMVMKLQEDQNLATVEIGTM